MSNEPNLDHFALWVAGLRDPDAKQATKALSRADGSGDCCLGIACKVAIANGLDLETGTGTIGEHGGGYSTVIEVVTYGHAPEKSFLPKEVADWLGIEILDPVIGIIDGFGVTATRANDTIGLTLPEIADMIEQYYLTPVTE